MPSQSRLETPSAETEVSMPRIGETVTGVAGQYEGQRTNDEVRKA
jgi:hypothetical protein